MLCFSTVPLGPVVHYPSIDVIPLRDHSIHVPQMALCFFSMLINEAAVRPLFLQCKSNKA